jgi:uncharacterized membrane protein
MVLLMSGVAYKLLQEMIIRSQGPNSLLKKAVGNDPKGWIPLTLYTLAIPAAFWFPPLSLAFYVTVAALWFVPDKRIERVLADAE